MLITDWLQRLTRPHASKRRTRRSRMQQFKVFTNSVEALEERQLLSAVNDVVTTTATLNASADAPGLLENDTGVGKHITQSDQTSALGATVTVNADGSYTYETPANLASLYGLGAGQTLQDSFHYTMSDSSGQSSTATVQVVIQGLNDAPDAIEDDYNTDSLASFAINDFAAGLLANDRSVDTSDTLAVVSFDEFTELGAVITMNSDGTFTYTHTKQSRSTLRAGEADFDRFNYTVTDASGLTDTATVTIHIQVPNSEEILLTASEDQLLSDTTPVLFQSLQNYSAQQPPTLVSASSVSVLGAPVVVNPDGSFSYDPRGIVSVNDSTSGQFVNDEFTYIVEDASGVQTEVIATIVISGSADGAQDFITLPANAPFDSGTPGLLANDPGNSVLLTTTTVSSLGIEVTIRPDGSFTYDPLSSSDLIALPSGESVFDYFEYEVQVGSDEPTTVTVALKIQGVDDPPLALDDQLATPSNKTLRLAGSEVLGNDYDIDLHGTTVLGRDIKVSTYDTTSMLGARVVMGPSGDLVYEPQSSAQLRALEPGALLIDQFTYTLVDAFGRASVPATIKISVTGDVDGPVAEDDDFNIGEDGAESADAFLADLTRHNVLANDDGGEGRLEVVRTDGVSQKGATVRISHAGDIAYDASTSAELSALMTGDTAEDSFTYTIADELGHESTATVTIHFFGANQGADDDFTTGNSNVLSVEAPGVLRNDAEEDEEIAVQGFDAVSENGAAVNVQADGSFTYDPRGVAAFADLEPGDIFYDTFRYTTDPDAGDEAWHTVTVAVRATNQAPELLFGSTTITLDSKGFLNIQGEVFDPDSTNFTGEATFGDGFPATPLKITNGHFPLVHAYEKSATYTVTVTLRDGDGAETVKTLTIQNPSETSASAYVAQLYHAVLERDPTSAEFNSGLTDTTLATRLVKSRDHQNLVIQSVYEALLNRPATAGEMQGHISALGTSELISGVIKAVALSNEFAGLHATPADAVQTLFVKFVGRAPTSSESQALIGLLSSGKTMANVLDAFLVGTPYLTAQVNAIYHRYVNTAAPAKDLVKLLKSLATHKTTFDAIAVKLLIGTAFKARVHGPVANSNAAIPRDAETVTPPTSSGVSIENEDGYYAINLPTDENGWDYTGFEITTDPLTNEFVILTAVSYPVKGLEEPVTQVFRDAFSAEGVLGIVVGGSELDDVIRVNTGRVHSGLQDPAFPEDVVEFDAYITVYGLEGDDLLEIASDRSLSTDYVPEVRLEGGDGNDTLLGGQYQNDVLIGGDGDDYLDGFGGDDILNGGFGVDTLVGGGREDATSEDDDDLIITGGPISDGDILFLDRDESQLTDEIYAGSPDPYYEAAVFGEEARSVARTVPATDLKTLQRRLTPEEIKDDDFKGMDIQLNGNVLTISGVAGYGFQLVGNWTTTTSQQQSRSTTALLDDSFAVDDAGVGMPIERKPTSLPKPKTAQANANNRTTHSGGSPAQQPTQLTAVPAVRTSPPANASLVEVFSTTGGIFTLKSAMGDIPILLPPMRITTVADKISNYGKLDGNTIVIPSGFTLSSSNNTEIRDELAKIGMSFGGQNMGFGIGLGNYVKESVIREAPLVDGIPYFYFNKLSQAPQVKQEGATLTFGSTLGVGMVFDPADPFFYVTGQATIGSVSIGYSHKGHIEFEPEVKGEYMKQVPVFGNVYFKGTVSLPTPVPGIDVGLEGTLVIDLDANNDGTTVFSRSTFNLDNFKKMLKGDRTILEPFKDDLAIGVNGKGTINFGKKGFNLELPVGAASLAYSPVVYGDKGITTPRKQVAFSGGTIDPFKGTLLERFSGQSQFAINGFANTDGFVVKATGNFKLTPVSTVNVKLVITDKSVTFDGVAQSPIPFFPNIAVRGRVAFDGTFALLGEIGRSIDFGPFSAGMTLRVWLTNTNYGGEFLAGKTVPRIPTVLAVQLFANFKVNLLLVTFGGDLFADARIDVAGNFSGSGNLSCFIDPPIFSVKRFNLGFSFNNSGLTIRTPSPIPDLRIKFK